MWQNRIDDRHGLFSRCDTTFRPTSLKVCNIEQKFEVASRKLFVGLHTVICCAAPVSPAYLIHLLLAMHSSSAHHPAQRDRLLLKTYFLAVLLLCSGLVMSALGMRKSLSIITPPFFLQPRRPKNRFLTTKKSHKCLPFLYVHITY